MSRPSNFTGGPNDRVSYPYAGCRGPGRDDCTGKYNLGTGHVFWLWRSGGGWNFLLIALGVGVVLGILLMVPALIGHSLVAMQSKRKIAQLEYKPSRKKASK